ncbi:FAST kinase domain-containing protein 3, mitochondrial [Callorhinchus milii]|uniref:FAST kinase domains 3 n=1 Tax=Callorhinchus milii TaxID=7868 RepID=A0A4W3JG97_CALMI|nr:FAST kinase domain-containing protein 3, mitochondrial [Callorhinchus milii]|eukprot:gi/632974119/ref/XP_007903498.1/ PREDICTED: FAST kinase domain-containing protein 3 [Callorhinchus milii]
MAFKLLRLVKLHSSKIQAECFLQTVKHQLYPYRRIHNILSSQFVLPTVPKICHQWVPQKTYHCVSRDQPYCTTTGTVYLHRDAGDGVKLDTKEHISTDEQSVLEHLQKCTSSKQVFELLSSLSSMSDTVAAFALLRISQVEQDENGQKRPVEFLDNDVFKALCFQFEREAPRLSDMGLVTALFAYVQLQVEPQSSLMVRLVSESHERLSRGLMSIEELCVLGEALLDLEVLGSRMLNQVMEQVQKQEVVNWTVEEMLMVYNLLVASIDKGGQYQQLLNRMNTHTLQLVYKLRPKAISDVLNAMVILKQTQAIPLVINLCKHSVRHVPYFSDQELIQVLNALMYFGHSDRFFIEALERNIPPKAFVMQPQAISKVMKYCIRRRILSRPILDAVAESFIYNSDNFTTTEIVLQLMSFGELNYLPSTAGQLFRKVENILRRRFSQFQPHALLNLLHSCILIERFPVNFVAKVFSPYFLQQLEAQGTGLDQFVRAQLTQLFMTVKLECPFYEGPSLPQKYRVKTFLKPGRSLETLVDEHLYNNVKNALIDLLGARNYFASRVLTPYCYTLDVEIKLDEEGYVLPAASRDNVYRRIALCIDDQRRFCVNSCHLIGKEAIKQRQLQLLGYDVVQIPFHEFDKLQNREEMVQYLHRKIFPHSYRLTW